jgi:uncharacterized protein
MGERTSHAPGTFSWTDLSTTDPDAAKEFYARLLGWEYEDMPAGEGVVYSMAQIDGKNVAAISPMQQGMEGHPPYWTSYVTVEDADAMAEKARSLGGNVLAPPFDVFTAGRMAVIQDPQMAAFAIWQPRDHIGAGLVNDPGALTLNQLNTSDPEAAAEFYSGLFRWDISQDATEPTAYWGISNQGRVNGGMMNLPEGSPAPPHWLVYFTHTSVDDAVKTIEDGGGSVMVVPMDVPGGGRILVAMDPQGAAFALFTGRIDD